MVLHTDDVKRGFPGLELNAGASGYSDNEAAAEDTLDPEDTAQSLAAAGRLDGYGHQFPDPGGLFEIQTTVDLFRSEAAATEFLKGVIEDLLSFQGKEIEEGVVLELFEEVEPPPIGTTPAAGKIVVNFTQLNLRATFNIVLWVRDLVVAGAQVVAFDNVDRSTDISLLARRMNLRINGVLAGTIKATPVVPPTPTPVPATPEEAALQAGFDLAAMALTLDDLGAGAKVSSEGYSEEERAISSYEREFKPEGVLMDMGTSSKVLRVSSTLTLYTKTEDAKNPVFILQSVVPSVFAEFAGPVVAPPGATLKTVTAESLDLPDLGDASVGFIVTVETELIDYEGHMASITQGPVIVDLVVVGPAGQIAPEDTLALARLISQRIADNSP